MARSRRRKGRLLSTTDMLMDLGDELVEARLAEEPLAFLKAGAAPSLVVTDHLMPGMNGAEFARALKTNWPDLRVVIVSDYAQTEGIDPNVARLTKPFRKAELPESLSALHGGHT